MFSNLAKKEDFSEEDFVQEQQLLQEGLDLLTQINRTEALAIPEKSLSLDQQQKKEQEYGDVLAKVRAATAKLNVGK